MTMTMSQKVALFLNLSTTVTRNKIFHFLTLLQCTEFQLLEITFRNCFLIFSEKVCKNLELFSTFQFSLSSLMWQECRTFQCAGIRNCISHTENVAITLSRTKYQSLPKLVLDMDIETTYMCNRDKVSLIGKCQQ